jgi:RIO kinase 1
MIDDDSYLDEYEYYEELFDLDRSKKGRKAKGHRRLTRPYSEIVAELGDVDGLEAGFHTTYKPGRYEEGWLLSSLRTFYDQALISDVLAQVKGGKEASVYCCEGDPTTGVALLAAKVYRPRKFRNLRNDKMYREGREILTASGRPAKKTDHRIMRAIGKKTAFGVQVQHTSWLMHEYKAMERLHQAGAAVPQPIAASENAILMSYYGDERMAAPTLNHIHLEPGEAEPLFRQVLQNVELMLQHDLIHGDLSAYNILYWAGEITLIDFPQVTNMHTNSHAYSILQRDVKRTCEYFAQQGVRCDPDAIVDELWDRYAEIDPLDQAAKALDQAYWVS